MLSASGKNDNDYKLHLEWASVGDFKRGISITGSKIGGVSESQSLAIEASERRLELILEPADKPNDWVDLLSKLISISS